MQTRLGLLHKFPMLACLSLALLQKRRLVRFHADFALKECYVRSSSERIAAFNLLQTARLVLMTMNMTSLVIGMSLSGYYYFGAVYKHYLLPLDAEQEMLTHSLADIRKYRNFHERLTR